MPSARQSRCGNLAVSTGGLQEPQWTCRRLTVHPDSASSYCLCCSVVHAVEPPSYSQGVNVMCWFTYRAEVLL